MWRKWKPPLAARLTRRPTDKAIVPFASAEKMLALIHSRGLDRCLSEITEANAWRVIWREINVGLLNGLMFAAISGLVGLIWFGSPILGAVLGLAMIGNLLVAGLAGTFIPLGLDRFGLDPALASGDFVTTVTDVVGFFCFLALAGLILL